MGVALPLTITFKTYFVVTVLIITFNSDLVVSVPLIITFNMDFVVAVSLTITFHTDFV